MEYRRPLRMLKGVAILPTLITIGNLSCGACAIYFAALAEFAQAAWLIFLALIFDALDGRVARATGGESDFGAELDSLADVVTFGAAPATMVALMDHGLPTRLALMVAALYLACTAVRLARFNVETGLDEESHDYFEGLPAPAAGCMIASLVLFRTHLDQEIGYAFDTKIFFAILVVLAVLMVSRIKYVHVVNLLFRGKRPLVYLLELLVGAILLAMYPRFALVMIIGLYVVWGPFGALWPRAMQAPIEVEREVEAE